MKQEKTFWAKIYLSGPIEVAKQLLREECVTGLCVTVEPTTYIYTSTRLGRHCSCGSRRRRKGMSVCNDCQRDFLHCRCDLKALQARVNGLERLNETMLKSLDYTKEENSLLRKVVDAARECYPALLEIDAKGVTTNLGVALRELDGEKITKAVCAHEFESAIDPARPSWCSKCGTEG